MSGHKSLILFNNCEASTFCTFISMWSRHSSVAVVINTSLMPVLSLAHFASHNPAMVIFLLSLLSTVMLISPTASLRILRRHLDLIGKTIFMMLLKYQKKTHPPSRGPQLEIHYFKCDLGKQTWVSKHRYFLNFEIILLSNTWAVKFIRWTGLCRNHHVPKTFCRETHWQSQYI